MYRLRAKHSITMLAFLAFLAAGLVPLPVHSAGQSVPGTLITGMHFSVKGKQTRLIFDAEGARPRQIGPSSSDGISVFFTQMTSKVSDRKIEDPTAAFKDVKFRNEGAFLEVLFREANTPVTPVIKPGRKPGKYTIVLEMTTPPKSATVEASKEKPEKIDKPVAVESGKRIDASELFGAKGPPNIKNLVQADDKKKPEPAAERPSKQSSSDNDPHVMELFQNAEDTFESCQRSLVLCGQEVIEAYGDALKAAPNSARAPLALYRIGLAYLTMGNYNRAERYFRQVLSDWPDNPVISRCWIGIGNICNKKQAYIEALEAFRSALRLAVDKSDKAAGYFELGRQFQILGASKEALELLNQCGNQDPEYYNKKPELIRLLGESEFSLGIYDKSKEHLLRFVNMQQSATDQDVLYAKIAETLLTQGDVALANKMHAFIRKYYTDSEGDFIGRIRHAELMERANPEEAFQIYQKLRAKELSPVLRRIVIFKLANLNWKKGALEQSLELMDDVFQGKSDAPATPEMTVLRERILSDLVKKYMKEKKFAEVVQLHQKQRRAFDDMQQGGDVFESIADSYGAMKFYSNALEIHERSLAKSQKKNEEQLLRCALYAVRVSDYAKAAQFCGQIKSDASDTKKSEILGHVFHNDQKYADAAKSFAKVLQKQKEFDLTEPDSLQSYGHSLFEMKKYDEAVPVLQKGLDRIRSENPDQRCATMVMLGKCFAEMKQYLTAAEMMEAALSFAREEQANGLMYETAKLYVAAGQPQKAIQGLNQLIGSQNQFWAAVAQQQLNTIQMSQTNQPR